MTGKIRYLIQFFNRMMTPQDRVYLLLATMTLLLGSGLLFLNNHDFHFTTNTLFASYVAPLTWFQGVCIALFCLLFLIYGMWIQTISPRSSTFIWGCGVFFSCLFVNIVWATGLQATPFAPIDQWLVKIDRAMGINTPALMNWTHQHPLIHHLLTVAYRSIAIELLFVPFLLMVMNNRRAIGIFFIAQLSSLIVGGAIYYFFPTLAPSGVFHSPYFSAAQLNTSVRFYDVHHFIKNASTAGGLIAFPSFHVIWVILLANTVRSKKIVFYPLAVWNGLIILSTVLLGWHYCADVIAGVVLAIAAIKYAEWVCSKQHV